MPGMRPDIITLAKGIASGFPLSALIARKELMEQWAAGTHGGTFGGNPVACAAALASIEILEQEGLANATEMGAYFQSKLKELQAKYSFIGDVRGLGVMVAMEFTDNGKPDAKRVEKLRQYALEHKLIILSCGTDKNVIHFMPSTLVKKEEIDQALQIIEQGLRQLA